MELYLKGHDYRYAAEQIMLLMFPGEKPKYLDAAPRDGRDYTAVSLSWGKVYATAYTKLVIGGCAYTGLARVAIDKLDGKLIRDRLLQRIIKFSFYRAAVKATGQKPPWGALTGIRPGRFLENLIQEMGSEEVALKALERDYYVSHKRAKLCLDSARAGLKVRHSLNKRDICLYIGIPFCPTRCAYCSFVSSSVEKSMKLIAPFLEALYKELTAVSEIIKFLSLNVVAVYIGGGTPTTLSAQQLKELIEHIYGTLDLNGLREFTVEAGRPDTITREKLETLKELGIDRISINPQTMEDEVLSNIGRRHSAEDIFSAFAVAKEVGGIEINADLIAGLPGDSPAGFKRSLDKMTELSPENITVHTLSMKKGSRLMLEQQKIPDGSEVGEMLDYAMECLSAHGYSPYYLYRQKYMSGAFENVGWCKKDTENIYNICIMEELCSIIALGAGGSTKLVNPKTGHIERIINAKYPTEYIERIDKIIKDKDYIYGFYSEDGMQ